MADTSDRIPRALGYRQTQVLAYVRLVIDEEGTAPSYAMIRRELGFPNDADVLSVVERLEKRGLLKRVGAGRVRRIRLMA